MGKCDFLCITLPKPMTELSKLDTFNYFYNEDINFSRAVFYVKLLIEILTRK